MSIFGNRSVSGNRISEVGQSNALLFAGATTTLVATPSTVVQQKIQAPNSYHLHNLFIDLAVTDVTGATTAPSGVNSAETVLTSFILYGKSGKQLLNINPSKGDKFGKLQHRFNNNGFYVTPPTPADTAVSTTYPVHYYIQLMNWVVYNDEFPLNAQYTVNTLASRATTLNSMTSTVSVSAWGDFVPLASALPRTVITVKPVTSITATNYDFSTFLDSTALIDVSVDVGADDVISSGAGAINVAVNNNSLIPNTSYQSVINAENQNYPISTPHIGGYFPLNVLKGMRVINPAVEKDTLQINFASQPTATGVTGEADLILVETY